MEAETGGMRPQAHRCLGAPQELEEAGGTLPRASIWSAVALLTP